jgi:hypothetical protein
MPIPNRERVKKYTNTLHGRFKELLKGAKFNSKKRNEKFELSYDDLQAKWNEQDGLCLYTNWKMSTITNDPKLVSVERKDNSKPYSKENVILVCWCANRAKNIMVFGQFLEMCQAIVEKQISEGSLT